MSSLRVSRRQMVGVFGAAAVAVPALSTSSTPAIAATPGAPSMGGLLDPLRAGSRLGEWIVVAIGPMRAGAISVAMKDSAGARFHIDVCRRDTDPAAPSPPARSERCDLFLSNDGDGVSPTREGHGLAAIALAEIVRSNEHALRLDGMLTRRERLERHPLQVAEGYRHLG